MSIGDALAVATLNNKNISKKDFKKFHPSGNLGAKLKTVEDIMLIKDKVPFISENSNMKIALKILTQKIQTKITNKPSLPILEKYLTK